MRTKPVNLRGAAILVVDDTDANRACKIEPHRVEHLGQSWTQARWGKAASSSSISPSPPSDGGEG
ncbi:MAG: hypothetical protein HY735_22920 [Verrucomicrobia bacterium]|nr:hypothetical protein [Verrucomicrobiota bacterium]